MAEKISQGAAALRSAIRSRGIKQREASEALAIGEAQLSHLLSGRRLPSRVLALAIRDQFGVGVDLWDREAPA